MDELQGCGNHGCIVAAPKGLGTNGQCTCANYRGQRCIHQLRKHVAELEENQNWLKNKIKDDTQCIAQLEMDRAAALGRVQELEHRIRDVYRTKI